MLLLHIWAFVYQFKEDIQMLMGQINYFKPIVLSSIYKSLRYAKREFLNRFGLATYKG